MVKGSDPRFVGHFGGRRPLVVPHFVILPDPLENYMAQGYCKFHGYGLLSLSSVQSLQGVLLPIDLASSMTEKWKLLSLLLVLYLYAMN